jgi:hypothetical protein
MGFVTGTGIAWAVNPDSSMDAVKASSAVGFVCFVMMVVRRDLLVEDGFIGSVFFGSVEG